jgi:hypothetical protein
MVAFCKGSCPRVPPSSEGRKGESSSVELRYDLQGFGDILTLQIRLAAGTALLSRDDGDENFVKR